MKANNNFHPKSNIQLQIENIATIESLRDMVRRLNEKYAIANAIFGFNGRQACELVEGYMEVKAEYDSLDACLGSITNLNECVQVKHDNRGLPYVLGVYHQTLSTIPEGHRSIDIKTLDVLNEGISIGRHLTGTSFDVKDNYAILRPTKTSQLGPFENGSVFFVENPTVKLREAAMRMKWDCVTYKTNSNINQFIMQMMKDDKFIRHAIIMTEEEMLKLIEGKNGGAEEIIDK